MKKVTSFSSGSEESLERSAFDADEEGSGMLLSKKKFSGALFWNFISFLLPALYGTLSKLWVANIDSSLVATTDSYTYASTVTEVINEGLPRAAFLLIGNKAGRTLQERLRLSVTLVAFQSLLGLVLSCCFLGAAPQFAAAFVPANIVDQSVKYVRISAFSSLFSTISVSIAAAARSLDQPDIPFVVSLCTTSANIVLDMCFLSTFRPAHINPTVNTQAAIRLACDGFGAAAGLAYFARILWRLSFDGLQPTKMSLRQCRPSLAAWKTLARAGQFFFAETVVRNALYLWQVHTIIGLGSLWATSFGVFNTIRWGLIMVPVQTLEATALVFVGHRFGEWTKRKGHSASRRDLFMIARPAMIGAGIALAVEVVLCILLSTRLVRPFAHFISNSWEVADTTTEIWRSIDWCYAVGYSVSTLMATVLLATRPTFYLANSLLSNLLWVLPWTIVVACIRDRMIRSGNFWTYYAIIFGGSLVFSLLTVGLMLVWWARSLRKSEVDRLRRVEQRLV